MMRPRAANEWSTRLTAGRLAPTIAARSDWERPSVEHDRRRAASDRSPARRRSSFASRPPRSRKTKSPACSVRRLTSFPRLRSMASRTAGCRSHGVEHGRAGQEQAGRGLDGDDRCRAGAPRPEGRSRPRTSPTAEGGEHGLLARGAEAKHDLDQAVARPRAVCRRGHPGRRRTGPCGRCAYGRPRRARASASSSSARKISVSLRTSTASSSSASPARAPQPHSADLRSPAPDLISNTATEAR